MENGLEGVKREHHSLGHRAGAPGLRSCKGTMRLLQESRGTSGLPEMKSCNSGLSGPVCGKEQKGCLFTFHIRPQRPCAGGRLPRGRAHAAFCRTHNISSGLLRGTTGPTGLSQQSLQTKGSQDTLNKALSLSWLSCLAQSLSPNHRGSIHHAVSEITRMSERLLPLSKNPANRTL